MDALPEGYSYRLPYEDDGEVDGFYVDAASVMAKANGVNITSDRELSGILWHNDKMVGATWVSSDSESYSFDIVVHKPHQGKGWGSWLLEQVIDIPDELQEIYPDIRHDLYAISPNMIAMLKKRGFEVDRVVPNGAVMVENPAYRRAAQQGFDVTKIWYHMTGEQFGKFEQGKSADTSIWLADDVQDLLNGEYTTRGQGFIIPVFIRPADLVGWDDYDRYFYDELIQQGKSGALLDEAVVMFHGKDVRSIYDDFAPKNAGKDLLINPDLGKSKACLPSEAVRQEVDASPEFVNTGRLRPR